MINSPDWNSDDAINLRAFLEAPTGRKMIQMLTVQRPTFSPDDEELNASFARSRSIAGYEKAVSELIALSLADEFAPAPPPRSPGTSMPDLDDDSQWPAPK